MSQVGVDSESGAVVWKLGEEVPTSEGQMVTRRFLDRDHVTTVTGKFEKKMTVEALPRARIDEAVKKARGQK